MKPKDECGKIGFKQRKMLGFTATNVTYLVKRKNNDNTQIHSKNKTKLVFNKEKKYIYLGSRHEIGFKQKIYILGFTASNMTRLVLNKKRNIYIYLGSQQEI